MSKILLKILLAINFLIFLGAPLLTNAVNPSTSINLAYNDGIECYLNGNQVISVLTEAHPQKYWNRQINVSSFILPGQNLIACRVSNGDGNSGNLAGYFDLELLINSQTIIPRGSSDWKFYGQGHVTTPPNNDFNGRIWYDTSFNDSNWQIGSTPFDGEHGATVLTSSPDDAWFRKIFNVDNSYFGYISNPTPPPSFSCSNYINQLDCSSHGCSWTGYYCQNFSAGCPSFRDINSCTAAGCYWNGFSCLVNQPRVFNPNGCFKPNIHRFGQYPLIPPGTTNVLLNTSRPLITGLVKYNSQVKVYADEKLLGDAVVQEGETTGVANFYFKPAGSIVSPDTFLFPHQLNIVATNLFDQSVCNNNDLKFQVIPYAIPVLHRLGEIPYVFRTDDLTIRSRNPLITGLTKYGSEVFVYVDNELVGKAKVKEGERSGVANFYFRLPILSLGDHDIYMVAKKIGEDLYSPNSQTFNFTIIP